MGTAKKPEAAENSAPPNHFHRATGSRPRRCGRLLHKVRHRLNAGLVTSLSSG
jgi:hypothetical protein